MIEVDATMTEPQTGLITMRKMVELNQLVQTLADEIWDMNDLLLENTLAGHDV